MPGWIALFISKNAVMCGVLAALLAVGLMWDRGRIKSAEVRGASKAVEQMRKNNDAVLKRAGDVRARSGARRVSGDVVDPNYID